MDHINPAARRKTYAELAEARDEVARLRDELVFHRRWGLRRRLRWTRERKG